MKQRTYKYLIDGVTAANEAILRRAIAQVPTVTSYEFKLDTSILIVGAASDPQDSVELACRVVGLRFRARVR